MLKSLTHAQRVERFGSFKFVSSPAPGNPEHITITDGWASRHIVQVEVPQLVVLTGRHTREFHEAGAQAFAELWQDWDDAKKLPLVLSFNGAWACRYKRNRGPKVVNGKAVAPIPGAAQLSNHSWGTAFDINARWNPLGLAGPPAGMLGSTEELVPIANAHGFVCGSSFSRLDPMHFEYVGDKA